MAAPTILYIGASISAAYSPTGKQRFVAMPPDASGDIGRNVEALLTALPKRPKNVYVLASEVWNQAVNIESRVLRRVDKNQIPQLLAYEAQSLSGMSDNQARTAVQLLENQPGESTFWVAQLEASRFTQISDGVAFSGGRLQGVLHPAGLTASINRGHSTWSRLEIWDDVTLAVWKSGRGPVQHRILDELDLNVTSSAEARRYLSQIGIEPESLVEVVRESAPADAELDELGNPVGPADFGPAGDEAVLDYRRQSDLERHLMAWSRQLSKSSRVPVIRPVRAPASAQTKRTMALAAVAAAILAVVGHFFLNRHLTQSKLEQLTQEVTTLQQPITAFQNNNKRLDSLNKELSATEGEVLALESGIEKYRQRVNMHQGRIAGLLDLLAKERPEGLVINNIQSNGDFIRITGRSVTSEAATNLAQTLTLRLEKLNLSLSMPRCEALLLRADGSPYEFEFEIRDRA